MGLQQASRVWHEACINQTDRQIRILTPLSLSLLTLPFHLNLLSYYYYPIICCAKVFVCTCCCCCCLCFVVSPFFPLTSFHLHVNYANFKPSLIFALDNWEAAIIGAGIVYRYAAFASQFQFACCSDVSLGLGYL